MTVIMTKSDPTKALALCPTFSPADVKSARLWLITTGHNVSTKGRVNRALLTLWHEMGRPVIALPERREYTVEDRGHAKRWLAERNGTEVPKTITRKELDEWSAAGSIQSVDPADIAATIEYQAYDKLGRYNASARLQQCHVFRSDMPSIKGRPPTLSYIESARFNADRVRVRRIITSGGAIHSVSWDSETEEYVISWESKADQRAVIVALLETIAQYRALAESHNLDTSGISALEDSQTDEDESA